MQSDVYLSFEGPVGADCLAATSSGFYPHRQTGQAVVPGGLDGRDSYA